MTITREKFIAATGREPQDDELERINHAIELREQILRNANACSLRRCAALS